MEELREEDSKFKREMVDEILAYIREKTGASGIVLMLADSQMPCPDSRSGEGCTHGGHKVVVSTEGISKDMIIENINALVFTNK